MTEAWMVNILLGLVATLFGILIMVLGWIGNKVYERLGVMVELVRNIEKDLHGKISNLDRRVTVLETKSGSFGANKPGG